MKAWRWGAGGYKYSSTLSLISTLFGGWVFSVTSWPLYPLKQCQYPLHRRLGEPRNRCGRVRKIAPPIGFESQNIQSVASRYTDCATVYTGRTRIMFVTIILPCCPLLLVLVLSLGFPIHAGPYVSTSLHISVPNVSTHRCSLCHRKQVRTVTYLIGINLCCHVRHGPSVC